MAMINPCSTTPPSPSSPFPCTSQARSQLGAALRTALACAAIGVATVYGPAALQRQATFPAFSYVTALLIAGDQAVLGGVINGTVCAVWGTALGALPAVLTLLLIPPEHFSSVLGASLAVGLSAFAAAAVLPADSTSLTTKRIALGQIVLIYAAAILRKDEDAADSIGGHEKSKMEALMYPVQVAASTAVGVVASLLAVLIPYPRLSLFEVREKGRIYKRMAAERLRLLVNAAFIADASSSSSSSSVAFSSQALSFKQPSIKLLQSIKLMQTSTQLEIKPPLSFMVNCLDQQQPPEKKLEETEVALQGMEMALLQSSPNILLPPPFSKIFHLMINDNSNYLQFKFDIANLRDHLMIKLLQDDDHYLIKPHLPHDPVLLRYDHLHLLLLLLPSINMMPLSVADLSPFFFLFCLRQLLQIHSAVKPAAGRIMPTTEHTEQYSSCSDVQNPNPSSARLLGLMMFMTKTRSWCLDLVSSERVIVALKCSLSVGLAVFFGAVFSRDNAFWSGLVAAVTITPWREATFKLASLRAQGTTLGSVYGLLGALLFQDLMELRFLVLLPWIIFTSAFLQRSRMFGPAGGAAAAISAIFILGRKYYESPAEFAITRLVETFIACACSIFVELTVQPKRASVLAAEQLRQSFAVFIDCVEHSLMISPSNYAISSMAWREKENLLRQQVNALRKRIGEAETEPNFWFLPFPVASYRKLHFSVSKMVDLLSFLIKCLNLLEELRKQKLEEEEEDQHPAAHYNIVDGDTIEQFKMLLCSSLKCFQEITQVKSLSGLTASHDIHKEEEEEKKKKNKAAGDDIEAAAAAAAGRGRDDHNDQEEGDQIVASLLGKAKEVIERVDVVEEEENEESSRSCKVMMLCCFGTLGFCIDGLMRETREIEKGILELLQSQNPGKHINLQEILKQIH